MALVDFSTTKSGIQQLRSLYTDGAFDNFFNKIDSYVTGLEQQLNGYLDWQKDKPQLESLMSLLQQKNVCVCNCNCNHSDFEQVEDEIEEVEEKIKELEELATTNYHIFITFANGNDVNIKDFTWVLNPSESANTIASYGDDSFLNYFYGNVFNKSATYVSPVNLWAEPITDTHTHLDSYTLRFETLWPPIVTIKDYKLGTPINNYNNTYSKYLFKSVFSDDTYKCFLVLPNISQSYYVSITADVTYYQIQFRNNLDHDEIITDLTELVIDGKKQTLMLVNQDGVVDKDSTKNTWYRIVAPNIDSHSVVATSGNSKYFTLVDWTESEVINGQIFAMFPKEDNATNVLHGVYTWYYTTATTAQTHPIDYDTQVWMINENNKILYYAGYKTEEFETALAAFRDNGWTCIFGGTGGEARLEDVNTNTLFYRGNWDDQSSFEGGSVQQETFTLIDPDKYVNCGFTLLFDYYRRKEIKDYTIKFKLYLNGKNVTPNDKHCINTQDEKKYATNDIYWIPINGKYTYGDFSVINEFFNAPSQLSMEKMNEIFNQTN